jgi:hypothetical protein
MDYRQQFFFLQYHDFGSVGKRNLGIKGVFCSHWEDREKQTEGSISPMAQAQVKTRGFTFTQGGQA